MRSKMTQGNDIRRVCVIGAGLSGLVTTKELRDRAHEVVCYEKSPGVGGVFGRTSSSRQGAYDSTLLTVSNYFMAFSSLYPEERYRKFWTAQEYAQYLNRFVDAFNLAENIQFSKDVTCVERRGDGKWVVTVKDGACETTEIFDSVAVCVGKFRTPYYPDIEGLDTFSGEICHAYNFKGGEDFEGKRVVLVGLGESASDVAHDIARYAKSMTAILKSPPSVLERFPYAANGEPHDALVSRFMHQMLDSGYSNPLVKRIKSDYIIRGVHFKDDKKASHESRLTRSWWRMNGGYTAKFLNKNQIFVRDITEGRLGFNLFGIESIDGNKITCGDGEVIEADVVVFSTGYKDDLSYIKCPHIEDVEKGSRNLFQHMFHPKIGKDLAIIGFVRPKTGGVPLCAEMQARYFARLCSRDCELPSEQKMEAWVRENTKVEEEYYYKHRNLKELVIYHRLIDGLAKLIGCVPNPWRYFYDLRFLMKYFMGSTIPAHFRLSGAGRDPRARDVIKSLPVGLKLVRVPQILYLQLWMWIAALSNRATFGLVDRLIKRHHPPLDKFIASELSLGSVAPIDPLGRLCEHSYQLPCLKYSLSKKYGIDSKRISEKTTVGELLDMSRTPSLSRVPNPRADSKVRVGSH